MTKTEVETTEALLASFDKPASHASCSRCGDWGTVVITRGRTPYEVPCPAESCAAATKARATQNKRRGTAAYLDEITALSDEWIRYCNELPEGHRVNRDSLRVVLAASQDVHLDAKGRIAWRAGVLQFTAKPAVAEAEAVGTVVP